MMYVPQLSLVVVVVVVIASVERHVCRGSEARELRNEMK